MKPFFTTLAAIVLTIHGALADQSGWILETSSSKNYTGAPVANGRIGILPWSQPFSVRHVILNHVFERNSRFGVSRVLKGINPFGLSMTIDSQPITENDIRDWHQAIDMRRAGHSTWFKVPDKAAVSYTVYALRNMPYAGLIHVRIAAEQDIVLEMKNTPRIPDGYKDIFKQCTTLKSGGHQTVMVTISGKSEFGAQNVAASYSFITGDELPSGSMRIGKADTTGSATLGIEMKKGQIAEFSLFAVICSSRDFTFPESEAERQTVYALNEGTGRLLAAHEKLWDELWQADIEIEGDAESQKVVRFALFNLYGSCRSGSRLSMSPMGLSMQGYNGHVFWDSELWMYPPMLLLNEPIARSMMDYRTDRIDAARRRAETYGYDGAMFPWESDDSGNEATPQRALSGPQEHHITADIAIAAWNYYRVTGDKQWLREEGFPMIKQCARFWTSRVEPNPDGSYSVRNVVGADEYARGVDDNAFTNGAACYALRCACKAAKACGQKPDPEWKRIADNIRIPRFDDGTTKEFEGYDGQMIKQADANLLGYPLDIITDKKALLRDLEYYFGKIDPRHGPAMSYAIFCVQYARLGMAQKAYEMFRLSFEPNLREPFGVLAETAGSDNPYFATGAGGLLQAVINGFGGLEITDKGIKQVKTVLPPGWKKLTIKGVGPQKKTYTVINE